MIFESDFTSHLKFKGLNSYCWILVIQQYCPQAFLKQGTFYVVLRLYSVQTNKIRTSACMLFVVILPLRTAVLKSQYLSGTTIQNG